MATYDYVNRASGGADWFGEGIHVGSVDNTFTWFRRINLATAGDALTTTGAFGAADVLELFNVKAGHWIRDIVINVNTVEGATLAATIGDADNAAGFLVAGNLNSATYQSGSTQATYGADFLNGTTYHSGKLYTAADTIDMTLTDAGADVAIFDIWVFGVNMSQTYPTI